MVGTAADKPTVAGASPQTAGDTSGSPVDQRRCLVAFARAGFVFVGVIVIGWVLIPGVQPVEPAYSALRTAQHFQSHRDAYLIASGAWEIGMQAMLLWQIALAFYLWRMERGQHVLCIGAFVSGLTVPFLMMGAGAALAVAAFRPLADPGVTRAFSDLFYWIADSFWPPVTCEMFFVGWLIHRSQGRPHALPRYTVWLSMLAAVTMPLLWGPYFAKSGVFAANGLVGYFIPMGTWCLWVLGVTPALSRVLRSPSWHCADGGAAPALS